MKSKSESLLPPWFPDHTDGKITAVAQAKRYPYPAPETDYWMRDGLPELCPDGIDGSELGDRTPVLSVGSNRAPLQLRRKFGTKAVIPVTRCKLHDCDIVFAATLSSYCASPATPCPSRGTSVKINIAWLDESQLSEMHKTEARGVAYDYIQLADTMIDHGHRTAHSNFAQPIFGYCSRAPLLDFGQGLIAHSVIPVEGRRFNSMTEEDVLSTIKAKTGASGTLDEWILKMRDDKKYRHRIIEQIPNGPCPPVPWTVV